MPNLLYIDDDEALGRLVQRILSRQGFAVTHVTLGQAGLDALAAGQVDVVALDHDLPDQSGLEILAVIAAQTEQPPVVFVTGSDDARIAVAALKAGASDYVIKSTGPEFFELLQAALSSAIFRAEFRREKERSAQEIREARDRAESLAQQRAVLLREVNHRVANSLQLISSLTLLQQASVTDPQAREALADMRGRVLAVADVHRRLYTSDDVRTVSLHEYLTSLLSEIERSMPSGPLIEMAGIPIQVSTDQAVSIGVIVAELVTNACKYAYPAGVRGPVRVSLAQPNASEVDLVVEDDGVGRAAGNRASGTGIGEKIVTAMVQTLKGTVTHPIVARGTKVVVTFTPQISGA